MIDNPYWEQVKDLVEPTGWNGALEIGSLHSKQDIHLNAWTVRAACSTKYAWTVTSEESVDFVAEHAGGKLIDPLAGTGYWCYLLAQSGVDCVAYDLNPPKVGLDANHWHSDTGTWFPVMTADAVEAVQVAGADRTLLLAWPPNADELAHDVLTAYRGNRVIFIGEGQGGCTGDEDFFSVLDKEWTEVASHLPVRFWGIHDGIQVFDRTEPVTVGIELALAGIDSGEIITG